MTDKVFIIDGSKLPEFAHMVAELIKKDMIKEDDQYLNPKSLSQSIPVISESKIRQQIRTGKYGKKIGEKGKLVAKVSEVKKFNRL